MDRNFVLHVGTEKTGTTSIQRFLWARRHDLLKHGWLYPESMGRGPHIKLTACCLNYDERNAILRAVQISSKKELDSHVHCIIASLRKEIEKAGAAGVIISDEHINVHLSGVESLTRLRTYCERIGSVSKIIIYFRRQDHFLTSILSEGIKNAVFYSYNIKDPIHTFHVVPYRFDYAQILDNLARAFPSAKLIVRGYSESTGFDVVKDFIEATGLVGLDMEIPPVRHNTSLPGAACLPLLMIGAVAHRRGEIQVLAHWQEVVSAVSSEFTGPSLTLGAEEKKRFLFRFRDVNERLSNRYPWLQDVLMGEGANSEKKRDECPVDALGTDEMCAAIEKKIPGFVTEALTRICDELGAHERPYELAFPPEVRERWDSIKQKNIRAGEK